MVDLVGQTAATQVTPGNEVVIVLASCPTPRRKSAPLRAYSQATYLLGS